MKLAINGQTLAAAMPLPQVLDVLDAVGVKAIEVWPGNLPGGGTREEDERYEARDVAGSARLLRDRRFDVACVTLGFWAAPICFGGGGGARFADALRGAVDAAEQLGAGVVNAYSVGIPLSIWGEAVKPVAAHAAGRGIVVTLENEAHDESGLPHQVAACCEAVDEPGFGTQYDPCNYYHANVEPFPHAYERVKRHVRYVHLKGGVRHDPDDAGQHRGSLMRDSTRDRIGFVPLPDAAFNVEAIVRRLGADGYRGYVTLEPHVPVPHVVPYYRREVPYLRKLINEFAEATP